LAAIAEITGYQIGQSMVGILCYKCCHPLRLHPYRPDYIRSGHGGHGGQGKPMSDAQLIKENLKVAKHKCDLILILSIFLSFKCVSIPSPISIP
jgi:hypothetical protein